MVELTPQNALESLRSWGWIDAGPATVEALGGGVSNAVFRVRTPSRLLVVKQSRPQLRTRDAWFSDLDRVYREQEVMQVLGSILPPPTVPEVIFSDRANYVFAMSHAPPDSTVWKETLLAGKVDLAVGERAGRILGIMHETTARQSELVRKFADRSIFVQLRVEPFYRRIEERRPEVGPAVREIVDRMLSVQEALCHGDYSPKNILTHAMGFTLVDYETAHWGDPAMDLGFFLSHLLLKAVKNHSRQEQYFDLTRAFWRGYAHEVRFKPVADLVARGCGHLAVCLLARIDGTSPVDYLPEEPRREAVRCLARQILTQPPADWDEVLDRCHRQFVGLV